MTAQPREAGGPPEPPRNPGTDARGSPAAPLGLPRPALSRKPWSAVSATVVGLVWAGMLIAAYVFVARYPGPVAFFDDMDMVHRMVRGDRLKWKWLWSQHTYHRVPLTRLIYVALLHSTGDARAIMFGTVTLHGALALTLVLAVRRVRGWTSWSDAFFPLVWLNWGQFSVFLNGFSISFSIASACSVAILTIVAVDLKTPTWRPLAAIGLCVLLLPGVGGPGLTQVPALALWLAYAAFTAFRSRSPGARRAGWVALLGTIAAIGALAWYFVDFSYPPLHNPSESASQTWLPTLHFVTLGLGPTVKLYWPLSGWIVITVVLAGVGLLLLSFRERPEQRLRSACILACIAAVLAQGVSMGLSRGGLDPNVGFSPRYVPMPAVILCAVYLAGCLTDRRALGISLQFVLLLLTCLVLTSNTRLGRMSGQGRADASQALMRDARAQHSIRQLSLRHWRAFYFNPTSFSKMMTDFREAGVPPFDPSQAGSTDARGRALFTMLRTKPLYQRTQMPLVRDRVDEVDVLVVASGTELYFALKRDSREVVGRYGIHPRTLDAGRGGSLLSFSVELIRHPKARPAVLFQRTLDAAAVEADRGFQELRVELPEGARGEIVLRTYGAPSVGRKAPLGFWTDVELR